MSSNIAVITQDEFEETILPNPRLTMALPHLGKMMVAKIPEKTMVQKGLWGRVPKTDAELEVLEVQSHIRGSKKVKAHKRRTPGKSKGKNKKAKKINYKKKNGEVENSAIPNAQEDCKESKQLAHSLHIQELQNLFNSFY